MLNTKVKAYLDDLDQKRESFMAYWSENRVAGKIRSILGEDTTYELTAEDEAEEIAFYFMADYPDDDYSWGAYYGPVSSHGPDKQGQVFNYPDPQEVNTETLTYWARRAKETKHPSLSSRYADLVIDFSQKVISKDAHIELFYTVIDSNITICKELLANPHDCITKIKRALNLAIQINNQKKIAEVKEVIINLEKEIAEDNNGLWGFAFKCLILDFGKKITLNKAEKVELIKELEDRLARVKKSRSSMEYAVSLLAKHYANEKNENDLMRVLDILEKSFKASADASSDAIKKMHAYEEIQKIYQKYSKVSPKAKSASKRVLGEMGRLDLDLEKSFKTFSTTIEIEREDINNCLELFFGDKNQYTLETVIKNIAIKLLPKREVIENEFKGTIKKPSLQSLLSKNIIADDGISIAKLSPLEGEYANSFQLHALQYLQHHSLPLILAIDELKKQTSKQNIIEYFKNSGLFKGNKKIERSMSAYWDNDYLVSSHLFIPLIENAVRALIKGCGGATLKPNKLDGYDHLMLGKLLREEEVIVNSIFSPDTTFYLRLVLTNKLGMNLRNDFAHGLEENKFLERGASDRLFHIMACLSLVSESEEEEVETLVTKPQQL